MPNNGGEQSINEIVGMGEAEDYRHTVLRYIL